MRKKNQNNSEKYVKHLIIYDEDVKSHLTNLSLA